MNLWIIIGAVVAVLAFGGGMYTKGHIDGKSSCQLKTANAVIEGEKNNDKKTKEVIRLPDDNLRKRYCEWVRDDKDKCLQAYIPIGE